MHKEHTAHPRSQEQAATSPDLPLSDYGRTRSTVDVVVSQTTPERVFKTA
jgi:hypothetical protein